MQHMWTFGPVRDELLKDSKNIISNILHPLGYWLLTRQDPDGKVEGIGPRFRFYQRSGDEESRSSFFNQLKNLERKLSPSVLDDQSFQVVWKTLSSLEPLI
jgi:hypothetical protein